MKPVRMSKLLYRRRLGNVSSASTCKPKTTDATGSVAFSPDGKKLAFATKSHGLKLWDIAANREITSFPGRYGNWWFSVLAFSRDGRMLAGNGADGEALLWDVENKTFVKA